MDWSSRSGTRSDSSELFTDDGSDAGTEKLDRPQHLLVRQRRDTHLKSNTSKTADDFIHIQDPLCDGFGIADEQRTCPSPKLDRRIGLASQ
jgi:hypothetical protein